MAQDCVFCQIINKKSPANFVYEDDHVVAFLTNRPVNEGHTLVVPKKHYENIYEVPDGEVAHLFGVVKKVSVAVRDAMVADGIRVVQNNGSAAGQVIFHFHVHIIPMRPHEGFIEGKAYRSKSQDRLSEALVLDAKHIRLHLQK